MKGFFRNPISYVIALGATAGIALSSCTPHLNGTIGTNSLFFSNELRFVPTTKVITAGNQFQYTVQGGSEPYTFAMGTGRGSIGSSTGIYQAPPDVIRAIPTDLGEFVTVTVTDAAGTVATGNITIVETISMTSPTVTVGQGLTYLFGATGGIPPYSYDITAGQGSINNATGFFTAPASAGTAFVRVRDSENNEAYSFVNIIAGFGGSTLDVNLPVGNTYILLPAGGQAPYQFTFVATPSGTITTPSGAASAYVAPATIPGTNPVQVRVEDAIGQQIVYRFLIVPAVQISPTTKYLAQGQVFNFAASGGIPPYTFSLSAASPSGSVSPTGVFTATTTTGSAIVNVMDSLSNISSAVATIYPPLALSPANYDWQIGSAPIAFTGSNGDQSLAYSWTRTGAGTPSNGSGSSFSFTPASVHGSTQTVTITDASSNTQTATIRVYSPFMLTPASVTLQQGNQFTIAPSGGIPPHSFVLGGGAAGGGISATSGTSTTYTASGGTGSQTITVTDSIGNNEVFNITVNPVLAITPTSATRAVNPGPLLNQVSFSAVPGTGVPPYSFSSTCPSTITVGGLFSSPTTPGTCTITLSDSHTPTPNNVNATVTVNPALSLAISDASLDLQQTVTLTASGGVPPYTIANTAGPAGGTFTFISGNTATYKAGNVNGVVNFQVTDDPMVASQPFGTTTGTIAMPAPISWGTSSYTLSSADTQTITPTGGVPQYDPGSSYTFTLTGDTGFASLSGCSGGPTTCTGASATVTAGSIPSAKAVSLSIADGLSSSINVTFTLVPDVQISPASYTMTTANSNTFSVVGGTGVAPYVYSVVSGGGSIGSTSGIYNASGASASVVLRVRDRNGTGNTSDAAVTVNPALSISPTSATPNAGGTQVFTASGGVGAYTFSLNATVGVCGSLSGSGSSRTFTADNNGGVCTITVTDSYSPSNSAVANVTVNVPTPNPPTSPSLSALTLTSGTLSFTASAGSPNYVDHYEVRLNGGSWINTGLSTSYNFTSGILLNADNTFEARAVNTESEASSVASITQDICNLDYFISSGTCTLCAFGQYTTGVTAGGPSSCTTGLGSYSWTSRGGGSNSCSYSCNSGYGTSACVQCAGGTYDATPGGQEACAGCTAGNYCPAGASSQTACSAGQYCPAGSASAATCAAGSFCATPASQVTCSAGSYSAAGQTSCSSCVTGMNGAGFANGTVTAATSSAGSTVVGQCSATAASCNSGYAFSAGACVLSLPSAPSGPFINGAATTSLTLNWTAGSGATAYDVSTDGSSWTPISNVTSHTFTPLSPGTQYTLYVRSRNGAGTSSGISASAYTLPAAPTSLTWDGQSIVYLGMSWSAVTGATGYEYRIDGGAWTYSGTWTSTLFGTFAPNSTHTFSVRAINSSGAGPAISIVETLPAKGSTDCSAHWSSTSYYDPWGAAAGSSIPYGTTGSIWAHGASVVDGPGGGWTDYDCGGMNNAQFLYCTNGSWSAPMCLF